MIDEVLATEELSAMMGEAWPLIDFSPIGLVEPPTILWEGRKTSAPPDPDQPYLRFTVTPVMAEQSSLAGADTTRRYCNDGLINVQSFGPLQWDNGYEVANFLAIMAKRVFQGKTSPNGIWFRNCRTNRIGASGGWYQFNTIIEYQFDEQR